MEVFQVAPTALHIPHPHQVLQCRRHTSSASKARQKIFQQQCRKFSSPGRTVVPVIAKQPAVSPPSVSERSAEGKSLDCVIVGAGISGLCTAQALATKHGLPVTSILVTEARERVGGNITTLESDGYLWEEGPNSFQPNDSMLTMAVDSGLKDELVLGDPDAPRFVLWGGQLRKVPAGLGDLPFFDLMSFAGKIRAGLGALGLRPPPPGGEESVEQFVRRNLGDEVFERLIEPFCSGVYAGDPSKLSMKAAFGKVWKLEDQGGSIIGGTIKLIQDKKKNPPPPRDERLPKPKGQTVGSFRKGLISLPKAIASKLGDSIKLKWKLLSVKKTSAGLYTLVYDTPEGTTAVLAKSVVLTVPSYVASEILRPVSPAVSDALSEIFYPPVVAVTLSYPKSAIREDRLSNGVLSGFGQLHPRSQGVETLGTIYSSSLFPGRAPQGRVLLLNYIGGATNMQISMKEDDAIVEAVDRDLRKMLLKQDAEPPKILGVRLWPRAIPQFTVGHLDHVEAARFGLRNAGVEGIFLGGNYVAGVALGRCVEGAYETAETVSKYLAQVLPS
ncbi:hypothetical protein SELMODRAFT_103055 [Selaginella moellendorffii]|uniref:Protoporphyrinogen oxidase n=1 Tax=Selaginella moellendorffii TaxID=88036 RepID=D8RWD9_SELML|nr:protoporphyrinogen oxidase, chloroplastic [Selaginella moellendorffii]XP_024535982.1 protoporphyrinogen oxidase, chloroplastic [Selaginella moellendorffii]EFJ23527.1 hypothetical protein SELMODRAFT_103055 [Selaginella moellendorffii]|eukprot:XP_002975326.1 protoporphyrinogen oxidase, chloroplastic [Selaginella moellendorffii]